MSEEQNNNEFSHEAMEPENGHEQLSSSRPAVAAAPGKLLALAALAVVFIFIVVKSLFFGSKTTHVEEKTRKENISAPGKLPNDITQAELPSEPSSMQPPVLPPSNPPEPPKMVPPPPLPPKVSAKTPGDDQLKARIHSPMLTGATMPGPLNPANAEKKKSPPATSDPNSAFAQGITESPTETVEATQVKNLNRTLIQGKLIQAVLETALDSSLPGPVRAIVSHDTYAESGRAILIPKGSRLIGVYNSTVRRGQARVFIIWTRVVRPDGVDVAINSPGVDALGRAGMGGDVDNKYFEAFTTAIMTSSLDVAVAAIGDAMFGSQQQTTTTAPNAGSSVTSSPTATAMQQAVQNIGTVGQAIVNSTVNLQPVIHIDQGEMINIFINKDVVFPSNLVGTAGFIP